jgi:hypothetical protein
VRRLAAKNSETALLALLHARPPCMVRQPVGRSERGEGGDVVAQPEGKTAGVKVTDDLTGRTALVTGATSGIEVVGTP